ncbi:type II toxin-antitoxin system RelE/ParE family toxin [Lacticaseibacillus paracasei]|jgi:phage-related protein|uniref:Type II toxin-antitoxin system RelE/ParE family toxin n=1 Tax=Lacticaseibacillus hegangensis TaxID=2486010 RepID=A0ABW4CTC8_9LACO|nr:MULTISPECIES: type II toxin-antitoxin system RelE/ParE family toxin [Lacticaseibacillus]MBU6045534.1 type II toxin-antitoxin system RelE/ParE family toxin [Lacticaseibacillus paracasei]MCL4970355.1 type II toxin-antitoxin system RelE/ParE family toxin [Lacticaseibacillus paracasei]UVH24919.1 type II toxin-antitoxin system RelE/ParE family toxin [Lacticaseibacillus paracasei]UZD24988.1 type II toxin-antitoxin system RelE/ParE family toxin [Lacticaseibacillus paracasei]
MEKPKFRPYKRPNGHMEFIEFLDSLPLKERAKLQLAIHTTEELGLQEAAQRLLVKKLTTNLYELRSRQGKTYQRGLYFHVSGSDYVITHGFSKKTNKTPQREIDHAIDLRAEFYQTYKEEDDK